MAWRAQSASVHRWLIGELYCARRAESMLYNTWSCQHTKEWRWLSVKCVLNSLCFHLLRSKMWNFNQPCIFFTQLLDKIGKRTFKMSWQIRIDHWLFFSLPGSVMVRETRYNVYLTIILQNCAEYRLILSRRGCRPSWLKSDDIPQDWAG